MAAEQKEDAMVGGPENASLPSRRKPPAWFWALLALACLGIVLLCLRLSPLWPSTPAPEAAPSPATTASPVVKAATKTLSPTRFEAPPTPPISLSQDKAVAIFDELFENTQLNEIYEAYLQPMRALDAYIDAKNADPADESLRDETYFLLRDGITECEALRDALLPISAAKRDWLVAAGCSTEGVDWVYQHVREVTGDWIRQLYICKYAILYIDFLDASRLQAYTKAVVASTSAYGEHWYNMYLLAFLDVMGADAAKQFLTVYFTGELEEEIALFERYWAEDKEVLQERTMQVWRRVEESLDSFLHPSLRAKSNYPWFYAYLAYAVGRPEYSLEAIDLMLDNPGLVDDGVSDDMKAYCASLKAYLRQQLVAGDNRPFAFVYGVTDPGESLLELGDIIVTLDGGPIPAKSVFEEKVGSAPSTVQVYRPHAGSFTKHEFQLVIEPGATQIAFFPSLENLE